MPDFLAFVSDMHIAPASAGAERAQSDLDRPERRARRLRTALEEIRGLRPSAVLFGGDNTNNHGKVEEMSLPHGTKIWDLAHVTDRREKRMELTDLVRFRDAWYCGFREGDIHGNHPSGRARIIRSSDGANWETAALFDWDCADVREPKFSATAEGHLMVNTSLAFTSREARADGKCYQLEETGTPETDAEEMVARQSVTWLSADGKKWSSAYACPSGVNTWRWEVAWHSGMGYSVGYTGKDAKGSLYRTRDGKSWRMLLSDFLPEGQGNEASLAFGVDSTVYCLLRDGRLRSRRGGALGSDVHGSALPMFGVGKAPYYQEWAWKDVKVDWEGDGRALPVEDVFRAPLGGPKIIRLTDGRFAAAGRTLGPTQDDGRITLFMVDPGAAVLTKFAECAGTTYGSIVEHDGQLWVSFAASDVSAIFVGQVEIPA